MDSKLQKAIIQIIFNFPFFSVLNGKLKYVLTDKIPTFATDGRSILYNQKFLDELSINEVIAVIIHEIMHIMFFHVGYRIKNKNIKKWNRACDYAINIFLQDINITLPANCLYDIKYKDMSAEEIYNLLPDMESDYFSYGDIIEGEDDSEISEDEIKEIIQESILISEMYSKESTKSLERILKKQIESNIDWKEYLYSFVTEKIKEDYTFKRCNKRYVNSGFFIPSLYNDKISPMLIGVDTSGSINMEDLAEFSGHLNSLQRLYDVEFKVLYIDTKVCSEEYFDVYTDIELKPAGGGGTNFNPLFDYYYNSDEMYSGIIYFTDMYGDFPSEIPDTSVLWVTKNKTAEPPFGTKLVY